MKLFRLSQSTTLFDELKSKLENILQSQNLSDKSFNHIMNKFDDLQRDYFNFFEVIKTK